MLFFANFLSRIDPWATLVAAIAVLLFYFLAKWRKTFTSPALYFSDIESLKTANSPRWISLPRSLAFLSLFTFLLAFIDPHLFLDKQANSAQNPPYPTQGLAIYLVLDQSGSMAEEVITAKGTMKKVDLLKLVTKQFIEGDSRTGLAGRPNDLIGLMAFARGAHVLSPLTLDHAAILSQLSTFAPVGDNDQDGTSIGYAIFKTASMIAATRHYAQELIEKGEPAYTIKNTVMILITDGMQDPNPLDKGKRLRNMDIPEAAAYAKEQGIRLYIVNVEPKLAMEEYEANRHIMQRAAELTGGKFFMVDHQTHLEKIYRDIDTLEKSSLPENQILDKNLRPDLYQRLSFYPYLIAMGLFFLLLSIILDSTILRRIP
jgi:Ca-activated chloride channel family protein